MTTLLIIILCVELLLIKKTVKFYMLSQTYLYLGFYLFSIVLTTLYYYFYEDKISLYKLDFIENKLFIETIQYHLLGLIAFSLGVIVYYDLTKRKERIFLNRSFSEVLFFKFKLPNKMSQIIWIIFLIIIVLFGLTYGNKIFYRTEYLTDSYRSLQTITKLLSFILTVLLAISYSKKKLLSVSVFVFLMILTIGTGSRIGFLYFVVYSILVFQSQGNTIKNKAIFGFNLVLSFFFLSYIMTLRILENHGVFPYFASLFTNENELYKSISFNIYYSFIFGIFVSARTLVMNIPDWNNILISLNPVTGNLAGWYDIATKMRIYRIVPFSSNGEIYTMGKLFTFFFYFVLGLIVIFIDHKTRKFFLIGKKIQGFLIVILFVLFIVYSFEYNLRSTFRYIYYIFFFLIIFSLKIKKHES